MHTHACLQAHQSCTCDTCAQKLYEYAAQLDAHNACADTDHAGVQGVCLTAMLMYLIAFVMSLLAPYCSHMHHVLTTCSSTMHHTSRLLSKHHMHRSVDGDASLAAYTDKWLDSLWLNLRAYVRNIYRQVCA